MAEIKASAEALNYNYGEIITPYQLPGQRFDSPIGAFREKALMWRLGTFISMGLSGALILLLILQIYQPLHSVIAVQMTPKGFVRSAAPLTNEYTLPSNVSEQFIKNYIGAFFSKEGLESLIQKDKNFIQAFSSKEVTQSYLNLLEQINHEDLAQPIEISEVNLIGPNTYQAHWSQELKDASTGEVVERSNYSGKFIVDFITPETQELILQNPLGFYVKDLNFEKLETISHPYSPSNLMLNLLSNPNLNSSNQEAADEH